MRLRRILLVLRIELMHRCKLVLPELRAELAADAQVALDGKVVFGVPPVDFVGEQTHEHRGSYFV
jgi:hypothetical protein